MTNDYFIRELDQIDPLTICIAAICDLGTDEPKIVLCADKLFESDIKYEHGSKIRSLGNGSFCMLSSNDATKSELIIQNAREQTQRKQLDIKNIARIIAKECEAYDKATRERAILSKFGLTFSDIKSGKLSPTLQTYALELLTRFKSNFEAQFLLVGFDEKPHLFMINQEAEYEPYDAMGFAMIGSGSTLAFSDMSKRPYIVGCSLGEALFRVYSAKKAAESASGVGKEDTTLLVLFPRMRGNRIDVWPVEKDIKASLDMTISKMKSDEDSLIQRTIKQLQEAYERRTKKNLYNDDAEKIRKN